ncbi:hypothetical protein [Amycolatopsis taiwanensis]|uniref:hypothetical protein n=1 Tax=Amycolatopsis taiwanensis TaxID=342230 RepID=UPI00048102C2|nr:hypothetical protein [Amycolatopsis taiwanensis]
MSGFRFVPPPGWPQPTPGWAPPAGWQPPPSWPPAPAGWQFWVADAPTDDGRQDTAEGPVDVLTAESDLDNASREADRQEESTASAQQELRRIQLQIDEARQELVELNDAILLQQVGIYEYHHPLENAEQYKEALQRLNGQG